MIPIPQQTGDKLVELDQALQVLGRGLYGRKLFGEYIAGTEYKNFHLEVHPDGSFTLHFVNRILGNIDSKKFPVSLQTTEAEMIDEINLLINLVRNKQKLVSA
jgi:hypothetical protein